MTRIEQLKQFIAEDPNDPFLQYGLALEFLHHEPHQALAAFERLLKDFPNYLPTYYPAAHLVIELGNSQRGEEIFLSGMELAKRQRDQKTEGELKQAYEQWLFEREGS